MRRAAGAGDDDFEAAFLGALGVFDHAVRRAVRGNDSDFVGDFEFF